MHLLLPKKGPLRNLLCAAARNAAILLSVAIFPALFWYSYPLGPATTHELSIPAVSAPGAPEPPRFGFGFGFGFEGGGVGFRFGFGFGFGSGSGSGFGLTSRGGGSGLGSVDIGKSRGRRLRFGLR